MNKNEQYTLTNKSNKNVFIALIILVFILLFITLGFKSTSFLKQEKLKSDIKKIMENLNYSNITFENEKEILRDGLLNKVLISSGDDKFLVYIYNQSEIYNIVNNQNYKEIYSNKKKTLKNEKNEDVILLVSNLFGGYGKINILNGTASLRYFIPKGKYKVRRLNKNENENQKILIMQNTKDENMNDVETLIKEYEFTNDLFIEIEVPENTYLDISNNSVFELQNI